MQYREYTSARYRLPTLSRRCRHRADVEPLCKHAVGPISAMSGERRPLFCRYRADVGSDIGPTSLPTSPDVGPMCLCCLGIYKRVGEYLKETLHHSTCGYQKCVLFTSSVFTLTCYTCRRGKLALLYSTNSRFPTYRNISSA